MPVDSFQYMLHLKKLKPEPETVRERALKVFSRIEGMDDIKEMMLRAVESSESSYIAHRRASLCKITRP